MADTMKFGPEWLRNLADGPQSSSGGGGGPGQSTSKVRLVEHRYGREELISLFTSNMQAPSALNKFPHIFSPEAQTPIAFMAYSEDEDRLIRQGVNSQAVMRQGQARGGQMMPRGMGARAGLTVDRGGRTRGGRGRGEVYSRGSLENGELGGSYHRSRGPNKDGWEEVGNRKLERGFSRPYEDGGREREGHPRFTRSMSDNWRDRGPNNNNDDDDDDWRKPVSRERWTTRTNWREPGRGGHELESRRAGDRDTRDGGFLRRGFESEERGGRRMGDVPEWIDDGLDDVGSFDASGAFVSNKEHPYFLGSREKRDEQTYRGDPPHTDPDRQEGSNHQHQQQRREPEGWESTDNGTELGVRTSVGAPPPQQHPSQQPQSSLPLNNGREASGPPAGKREEEKRERERETGGDIATQQQSVRVGGERGEREGFVSSAVEEAVLASMTDIDDTPVTGVSQPSVGVGQPSFSPAVEEETPQQSIPVLPSTDEDALKWFYIDPQENLQGPFTSEDMTQWFNAGYFTMCLRVKRGFDHGFQPLGDLMKQWGQIPFLATAAHPPIMKPQTTINPPDTNLSSNSVTTSAPLLPPTTAPPIATPVPAAVPTLPPNLTAMPNLTSAALAGGAAPVLGAGLPSSSSSVPSSSFASLAGGVPGVGGAGPAPNMDLGYLMQQQLVLQNNILQNQVEVRQLQMQTLSQLQEQEDFKALDPARQQQLSLHIMHNNPALQQRMQSLSHLQSLLQSLQAQQLQVLAAASSSSPAPQAPSLASLSSTASLPPSSSAQQQQQQQPGVGVTGPVSVSASSLPQSLSSLAPQLPQQQQPQPQQQSLPSALAEVAGSLSSPKFNVHPSPQPTSTVDSEGQVKVQSQGDTNSIWGSGPPAGRWPMGQPMAVWELEKNLAAPPDNSAKDDEMERIRKQKEEAVARLREQERRHKEEVLKQQEELRRQAEALEREKQRVARQKEELERQRILDMQRVEELRRQQEEEQRQREALEAEKRKQEEELQKRMQAEEQRRRREEEALEAQRRREEQQRQKEEEERRRREEERRKLEEQEEWRRQEEIRTQREAEERALQELKQLEELRQQQEAERQRLREMEKKQEAEAAQRKKELEKQQHEALKRMQQQQNLKNIQLPSSANWAARQQQQQQAQPQQSRSLAEIQQEEEMRQAQQERERQQQMQRQQLEQQQQLHLQQQQKTWASNLAAQQPPRVKTLAEIQEEQERQVSQEKKKAGQQGTYQAKVMSLAQATAWPASASSSSALPFSSLSSQSSSTFGGSSSSSSSSSAPAAASTAGVWSSSGSIWGNAANSSIWGSANTPAPQPHKAAKKSGGKDSVSTAEFPSLHSQSSKGGSKPTASRASTANNASAAKPKKEEVAVQRLFKEREESKDEFTMWCEATMRGMDVQVDIETFVSFLKEVESPYEVHDYVKNYLGEGGKARQFAKDFLTRRSQQNNKARKEKQQEEESIWGPAPALNPREIRGNVMQPPPLAHHGNDHGGNFTEVGGKSKGGKKKKKMQKLDNASLLGFTVAKDPNRKNAGEIETVD